MDDSDPPLLDQVTFQLRFVDRCDGSGDQIFLEFIDADTGAPPAGFSGGSIETLPVRYTLTLNEGTRLLVFASFVFNANITGDSRGCESTQQLSLEVEYLSGPLLSTSPCSVLPAGSINGYASGATPLFTNGSRALVAELEPCR